MRAHVAIKLHDIHFLADSSSQSREIANAIFGACALFSRMLDLLSGPNQHFHSGDRYAEKIWVVGDRKRAGAVVVFHRLHAVSGSQRLACQSLGGKGDAYGCSHLVVCVYVSNAARGGLFLAISANNTHLDGCR